MAKLPGFSLPVINDHVTGWGPPPGLKVDCFLAGYPLESFDKYPQTKVGRVMDFTASGMERQRQWLQRQNEKGKGKGKDGKGLPTLSAADQEEGFELVDNRPAPPSKGKGKGKKGMGLFGSKGKGKGKMVDYQEGLLGAKPKFFKIEQSKGKGKGKGKKGKSNIPTFRDWSVEVKSTWEVIEEVMLSSLAKLQIDAANVKIDDVTWCGQLRCYDKIYDRVNTKLEKPLQRFESVNFFNVTTSDDPMMQELIGAHPDVTVAATDQVIASLMAAGRSVYGWDLVITKLGEKIVFDKRDGASLDFLTVNETSNAPPSNESPDAVNAPLRLGQEASCINQNFSQQVLDYTNAPEEMEHTNPFEDDEDQESTVASGAYRYRKLVLPGNPKAEHEAHQRPVTVLLRAEVDCKMPADTSSNAPERYASVKALNEFDVRLNLSWRTHLDSQRGAVLATELKNNAFKLARFTALAMVAGCDVLKLGYVTRRLPQDPWSHCILGVQTYNTEGFAAQIGMTKNNAYAVLRNIIDLIAPQEDGKYVLVKDPTKPVVRLYSVPWETFDEEGEELEEEEDDDGAQPQEGMKGVSAWGSLAGPGSLDKPDTKTTATKASAWGSKGNDE